MRTTASLFFLTLALVAFSPVSRAGDEIVLKDHHMLHGQVVSSTADTVVFKHLVGTEEEVLTFHVADVDPHSFYIIRSHAIGDDDAQGHVVLGKFCMGNGLFTRARNQFIEALKIDKSLADSVGPLIEDCRHGTADGLLAKARAAQAAGDQQEAYRYATEVLRSYGDSKAGAEAREIHESVHNNLAEVRATEAAARDKKLGDESLKPLEKDLMLAATENKAALQADQQSKQTQGFKKAEAQYKHVLSRLDMIQKEHAGSPELTSEIDAMRQRAQASLVDVYLNHGNVLLSHTDYQGATREGNKALAVDPESSKAQSFNARVQNCIANASRIGVGIAIR